MSDAPQGPGWWQASDGRWYPPDQVPGPTPTPVPGPPSGLPPGYGYAPGSGYPPAGPALPSVQGMAVASLVLGILNLVGCCVPFSGVLGVIGLPLGIIALRRISAGQADPSPRGLAIAGIVLSAIGLTITVGLIILVVVGETADTTMAALSAP